MATKKNDKDLQVRIIRDSQVWNFLPIATDRIIRDNPRGLHIFDDMKIDARVGSLFEDRRNATANLDCFLTVSEDARIQEYCEKYLSEQKIRKFANNLLSGSLTYGFQPAEIIWAKDKEGYYYIDNLDNHEISRYRFDAEGKLYYDYSFALDQPNKWIIHKIDGESLNRQYGFPYLLRAFWPWKFKQLGWEFWLKATEKFSVPSIVVLFDQSDPAKAQQTAYELADLVTGVSSGSGGAFANIKGLQQLSMGGAVSDFNSLISACDLQIAYGLTGQALSTNISDTGTQALGTVQERTKHAVYENDARALAYTMQKLVAMAIEVNFGPDAEVPVFSFDTGNRASYAEVIQAYSAGIPISKKAIYNQYGLPEPENEDDVLERPEQVGGFGGMGTAFNFADTVEGKKKENMIVIKRCKEK